MPARRHRNPRKPQHRPLATREKKPSHAGRSLKTKRGRDRVVDQGNDRDVETYSVCGVSFSARSVSSKLFREEEDLLVVPEFRFPRETDMEEGVMSSSVCDRLPGVSVGRQDSESCGESYRDAVRRGLRRSAGNLWLRTVVFTVATVVLASQVTCLQLSIDPNSGSVLILRDRRASTPSSDSVREFRECGGNLTALSRPARLYNPGYPKAYESNQLCRWVITADGDITLHFVNVEIEDSPGCEYVPCTGLEGRNS
ncbi:uncharacterized protein LOC119453031 [Dermacentor silvarum]|uniref:uncharacterized protein LOC119453031 n=1 Tax=Dermacentor silvarum TaxID=543639 RepID=UPI0021006F77|nr:uncharacterized protein LOC119453031 [Dermacentor silvarum]